MIEPIKVKLYRIKNVVLMEVLKQNDVFISKGKGTLFNASNGIKICSVNQIQLCPKYVYIRGKESEYDDKLTSKEFESETQAIEYFNDIKLALEEFKADIISQNTKSSDVDDNKIFQTVTI